MSAQRTSWSRESDGSQHARLREQPLPPLGTTYETVYAPPATVLLQLLQFQMPTECLLTVVLPQNVHTYLACCVISIFLTCFRSEAPYLQSCQPNCP